jgi:NADP-dependent 3-hydroxy acid dehydrogenase YdfG
MTILITGATAGIGEACARAFAAEGHRLILTGRRAERLEKLKEDLPVEVLTLSFDVREHQQVVEAIASIPEGWREIDVLVNNAGLAVGKDPIQTGVLEDWERMIDTNVKGFLYMAREIAPLMISRKKGHIINIGSLAGREVYPNGNVYCATKHAVHALSQGMRIDMLQHGIRVTQIAPGLVETEFSVVRYKGDQQKADSTYENFEPLTGEDIANIVVFAANQPPHVNINDILITPTAQANSVMVHRGELK